MNSLSVSIIVATLLISCVTHEEEQYVNEFCETKTFDYAFNFVDKDQYPNGIMIKKDDFITIFNDDLFDRKFTPESDLLKMYRKNNFTGGLFVKEVPKCPSDWAPGQCEENRDAHNTQMVINELPDQKVLGYMKDNKWLNSAIIPIILSTKRNWAPSLPSFWDPNTDLLTYWTKNYELIYVRNKDVIIFMTIRYHPGVLVSLFNIDQDFKAIFEMKDQIFLVTKEDVIYTYEILPTSPGEQKQRFLKEQENLTLYSLFDCKPFIPSKKEISFLSKGFVIISNGVMVIIAVVFIAFVIFQIFSHCTGKKIKWLSSKPSSSDTTPNTSKTLVTENRGKDPKKTLPKASTPPKKSQKGAGPSSKSPKK